MSWVRHSRRSNHVRVGLPCHPPADQRSLASGRGSTDIAPPRQAVNSKFREAAFGISPFHAPYRMASEQSTIPMAMVSRGRIISLG